MRLHSAVNSTWRPLLAWLCLMLILTQQADGKLNSSSLAQDEAKEIVEEIFRRTHLDEGESFWGERHREEIEELSRVLRTNYYTVFSDLSISRAMARCAVYAKYEGNYQRWLDEMDKFDRAAEELNRKDKGRYYFAKGLLKLQMIPDKLHDLPTSFYRAAENGYPSGFLGNYIAKGSEGKIGSEGARIMERLARSYRQGGSPREAYKFYLLASLHGRPDPEVFLDMVEVANAEGNEKLAYKTALLFLEVFSVYDGARRGDRKPLKRISVNVGMPVENLWAFCDTACLDAAIASSEPVTPPSKPIRPRDLNRFDNRHAQKIAKSMGAYEDLFEIALCKKYWKDSTVVVRFLPRISAGIDRHDGAIAQIAAKARKDPRFADDPDIAQWEARRWKAAGKLEEFAAKYPKRYKLAGMGETR